jgi:hypothetical protein
MLIKQYVYEKGEISEKNNDGAMLVNESGRHMQFS